MNRDEFFQVGKVVKTNGSSGEMVCILDIEYLTGKEKLESVFIQINGNLVPFFIDHYRIKSSSQILIKFLDTGSIADLASLNGCPLFLPISSKKRSRKNKTFDIDLAGYHVNDEIQGDIGVVTGVLELPMQELLEIDYKGKQILVPLVDDIVKDIDPVAKQLFIQAPEGLIDLYL